MAIPTIPSIPAIPAIGSGGGGAAYGAGTLTFTGDLITDAVRTTGEEGDGLTPPAGVGIWPAATNLVTNGGFESNFDGWIAENGTGVRSTDSAAFGDAAAHFTATVASDNAGVRMTTTVAAASGSPFTASCFIRSLESTELALRIAEYDSGDNFLRLGAAEHVVFSTGADFTRLTASATMGANTTQVRLFINTWGPQTADFYVDGVQFEAGSIATPYIETDGETASRTAGRVQVPVDGLFTETQGWVYARMRMGFASSVTGNRRILSWRDGSDNAIEMYFQASGAQFLLASNNAGTQTSATTGTISFSTGDSRSIIGRWSGTGSGSLGASYEGGSFSSGTRAGVPTVGIDDADIGRSSAAASDYLSSSVLWMAFGKGTLTDADAAALDAFGDDPPTPQMLVSAIGPNAGATALWTAVDNSFARIW